VSIVKNEDTRRPLSCNERLVVLVELAGNSC